MALGNGSGVAVGAGNVGAEETAVSVAAAVVGTTTGDGEKTAVGVAATLFVVALPGSRAVGKAARLGVGSAGGSGVVIATSTDCGK